MGSSQGWPHTYHTTLRWVLETIYKTFYFQSLARSSDVWTPMAHVTYSTQVFVFLLLYCEGTEYLLPTHF